MKRVAVILWMPALPAAAIAAIDAAAGAARAQGQALHFYVLSPDQADTARYRHASVEYVDGAGWRRVWVIARLLQKLLVRYDVACLAGLAPALAFFCRGYRLQLRSWMGLEWCARPPAAPAQLLRGRWFPGFGGATAVPALLAGAAAVYDQIVKGEQAS